MPNGLILPEPPKFIHPTDLIIGQGLITAETISQELRERLERMILRMRGQSEFEIFAACRNILNEFEPLTAEALLHTDLAAWIAGFDRVANGLPPYTFGHTNAMRDSFFPPPPNFFLPSVEDEPEPIVKFPLIERARDNLFQRKILTPQQYRDATAAARNNSFTVAGDLSTRTLESIQQTLAENVRDGASFKLFRQQINEKLGTSPIGAAHLETVYRTNVQAAFSDGHNTIAENPIVRQLFPYQEYLPIRDARARREHLALGRLGLNGTGVYRYDDPMWDFFDPPWDYNCRCGKNLLAIDAAARKGVREAQEWLRTSSPPSNPEWRINYIPFRPKNSFGGARRKMVAA